MCLILDGMHGFRLLLKIVLTRNRGRLQNYCIYVTVTTVLISALMGEHPCSLPKLMVSHDLLH